MDIELKSLLDIDYDDLSVFYRKVQDYPGGGRDDFVPFTPLYTKYSIERTFLNRDLYFGIYSGTKMIGTIGGTYIPVSFQKIKLLGSAITSYAIDPDYLPLERETLIQIFQEFIAKIKESDVDFLWVFIIKEYNSNEITILKEDFLFTRVNKNVEGLVKLLGSEGVEILKQKKDMNIILAKLAKMMAGMKTEPIPGGIIRDATVDDYPRIVELLNAYTAQLPLAQLWTLESFKQLVEVCSQLDDMDYSTLKSEFPDTPWGFHVKVWERDQKIIAAIVYRVLYVRFKNGDAPFGFWDNVAFAQDLELEEKKAFLITMYNQLYHKAIIINVSFPYYDYRTFDKAGFMSERRKTPFYLLPITENGKKILELERITKFYLPLDDFSI